MVQTKRLERAPIIEYLRVSLGVSAENSMIGARGKTAENRVRAVDTMRVLGDISR